MIHGLTPRPAGRLAAALFSAAAALLLVPGCGDSYPDSLRYGLRTDLLVVKAPEKKPDRFDAPGQLKEQLATISAAGGQTLDPTKLNAAARDQLSKVLDDHFGTPAHPFVKGIDDDTASTLLVDKDTLEKGSVLYRRHCLHCHGLTGSGQGPTAPWINPHPRDFRRGMFKFTSSGQGQKSRKPLRQDLARVLRQGVEGTAMPAFGALSNSQFGYLTEEEIGQLVSYVIHLSLRGQVEYDVTRAVLEAEANKDTPPDVTDEAKASLERLANYWVQANASQIQPEDPAAYARDQIAGIKGQAAGAKDVDQLKKLAAERPLPDELLRELLRPAALPGHQADEVIEAGRAESVRRGYRQFISACISCHLDYGRRDNLLYDDWGTVVRPLDVTLGTYRGGRRPIDLYWRIHAGIAGANMSGADQSLQGQMYQMWDIVNFVKAAPYPAMLPEDVRKQVYEVRD